MALIPAAPMDLALAPASMGLEAERSETLAHLYAQAEAQQARHYTRMMSLQKQAEQVIEANISFDERARHRAAKLASIEEDREADRADRAERALRMEELRQVRLNAAAEHEEQMRLSAEAKIQSINERLARFAEERAQLAANTRAQAAQADARREAAYNANQEAMESRRNTLLARQARVDEILQQREQLRQLQMSIKAEEDFIREQHRSATKKRADDDQDAKVAYYETKLKGKDESAARKLKEIDHVRKLRQEELQQRSEYLQAAAQQAAAINEAERMRKSERASAKAQRAEALAVQRARLMDEMKYIRQQMQMQEEAIRASITRLRQKGSLALPSEVVAQIEYFATGGPLRTSTSLSLLTGPGHNQQGGVSPLKLLTAGPGADHAASPAGRPKSAATTPRQPKYLTAAHSPSTAPPKRAGAATARGKGRPLSASVDFGSARLGAQRSDVMRSSATGVGISAANRAMHGQQQQHGAAGSPRPLSTAARPATAAGTRSAGPTPRSGATYASQAHAQAAAAAAATLNATAAKSAEAAAYAAASGRYVNVSEVAKPGSRREDELRAVLQEEITKEGERQAILAKVMDEAERARLIMIFAAEREDAKKRILSLSSAAQAPLSMRA